MHTHTYIVYTLFIHNIYIYINICECGPQFIFHTRFIRRKMTVVETYFQSDFSTSRNFNFVPSEEIRRITNDVQVETNFSSELSAVTTFIFMPTTK